MLGVRVWLDRVMLTAGVCRQGDSTTYIYCMCVYAQAHEQRVATAQANVGMN